METEYEPPNARFRPSHFRSDTPPLHGRQPPHPFAANDANNARATTSRCPTSVPLPNSYAFARDARLIREWGAAQDASLPPGTSSHNNCHKGHAVMKRTSGVLQRCTTQQDELEKIIFGICTMNPTEAGKPTLHNRTFSQHTLTVKKSCIH